MRQLCVIIFFLLASLSTNAQVPIHDTIHIDKTYLVGRWVEVKKTDGNYDMTKEHPDYYVFNDDMSFFKGQSNTGVILFNMSGRYNIEGDSITVRFFDFSEGHKKGQKLSTISIRIVSLGDNEINAYVSSSKGEHFFAKLKKHQHSQ